MTHKIYARLDQNSIVTNIFSDALQAPVAGDVTIAEGSGINYIHIGNTYQVMDANMHYNYKLVNDKLVERTEEEKNYVEQPTVNAEEIRARKLKEISEACTGTIYNGIDVQLTSGETKHYALTLEDQININGANDAIKNGATQFPYHADGEVCELYSAEDITKIAKAATEFVLYNTTYCNHLRQYVLRTADVEALEAIRYGAELPTDLQEHMQTLLAAAEGIENKETEGTANEANA